MAHDSVAYCRGESPPIHPESPVIYSAPTLHAHSKGFYPVKKKLQIVVGLLLGVFLVWFVFRGTDWAKVGTAIAGAHWGWLAVSFLAVVASFFTRTQRWAYIVRTSKPVPYRTLFNATQIGFLANFTLPARAGEVIRALVLGRREKIPFSKCVAFVALDRVTDFFGLFAVLLVTILFFHPTEAVKLPAGMEIPAWAEPLLQPGYVRLGAEFTGLVLGVLVGSLVLIYANQRLAVRLCHAVVGVVSKGLAQRLGEMIVHFAEGLHIFRSWRDMARAIGWSLLTWSLSGLCYWAIVLAFGLSAPWYSAFVILALLSIAITLPGAPGFIGQFHIGIILPLVLVVPNIEKDVASAVAILSHLVNLGAVVLVGLYSLQQEHLGLLALQQEGEAAAESLSGEEKR